MLGAGSTVQLSLGDSQMHGRYCQWVLCSSWDSTCVIGSSGGCGMAGMLAAAAASGCGYPTGSCCCAGGA